MSEAEKPTERKLTAKVREGEVTLPDRVIESLQLKAGDYVEFIEDERGFLIRKWESPFEKYRGILTHLAGRSSDEIVEEMRGR